MDDLNDEYEDEDDFDSVDSIEEDVLSLNQDHAEDSDNSEFEDAEESDDSNIEEPAKALQKTLEKPKHALETGHISKLRTQIESTDNHIALQPIVTESKESSFQDDYKFFYKNEDEIGSPVKQLDSIENVAESPTNNENLQNSVSSPTKSIKVTALSPERTNKMIPLLKVADQDSSVSVSLQFLTIFFRALVRNQCW